MRSRPGKLAHEYVPHMRFWRSAAIGASLLLAACGGDGGGGARRASVDVELQERASEVLREHELPAFGLAEIEGGAVRAAVAGRRTYGSGEELPTDAPFHLGSNTKAMTAMLLATFVEDGAVALDDKLSALFSGFEVDGSYQHATIRDVLAHEAGLTDEGVALSRLHGAADPVAARAELVAATLKEPAVYPGRFHYANVNYVLIGVVAERLGAESWEDLMGERVDGG